MKEYEGVTRMMKKTKMPMVVVMINVLPSARINLLSETC